jgi:hypothetical protein
MQIQPCQTVWDKHYELKWHEFVDMAVRGTLENWKGTLGNSNGTLGNIQNR